MNKKIGIIAGILIILLVAGGAFAFINMQNKNPNQSKNTSSNTNSAFSSIKEALSKNLTLQCDVNTKDNKSVTYIKNGKIRVNVTGKTEAEAGNVIIKDNKMYFWNAQGGFVMEFNPQDIEKNTGVTQAPNQDPQAYLSMVEKYKESCRTAVVDDGLFTPPANVTFQDISKMMKTVPSGTTQNDSQQPNQAQIEELMKQYDQTQQ